MSEKVALPVISVNSDVYNWYVKEAKRLGCSIAAVRRRVEAAKMYWANVEDLEHSARGGK